MVLPVRKSNTITSSLTGLKTSVDDVFQFVQVNSQPVLRPVQFSEYKTHRTVVIAICAIGDIDRVAMLESANSELWNRLDTRTMLDTSRIRGKDVVLTGTNDICLI